MDSKIDPGRDVVISGFSNDFYLQPCLSDTGKDVAPYRINNTPLFDKDGHLNAIYSDFNRIRATGEKSSYVALTADEDIEEEKDTSPYIAYGTFTA